MMVSRRPKTCYRRSGRGFRELDINLTEDLVAAVAPVEGVPVDVKGIFSACMEALERNSVPSYLQVVAEIPKTASQKNLARVLRDEFDPEGPGVYGFEDYK